MFKNAFKTLRSRQFAAFLFVATLSLGLGTAIAKGEAKRPSDKRIEAAVKTLVEVALSHPDGTPRRQMASMAVFLLVSDYAGVTSAPGKGPQSAAEQKKLAAAAARLSKKGIAVDVALAPMLKGMKRFRCRSMQAEAKTTLKGIYVSEEMYRGEFNTYQKQMDKLDALPRNKNSRYRYEITQATTTEFKIRATGTKDTVKGDVWEISQLNDLQNVKNACPP